MKHLSLIFLMLVVVSIGCGNSAQTVQTVQTTLTPTNSPNIATKLNRDNFVSGAKNEVAKKGVFISSSGSDSEIMNVNSRLSVSECEKLLQTGFDDFRDLGFKQIVISGKDGIKTINL